MYQISIYIDIFDITSEDTHTSQTAKNFKRAYLGETILCVVPQAAILNEY